MHHEKIGIASEMPAQIINWAIDAQKPIVPWPMKNLPARDSEANNYHNVSRLDDIF